MPLHVLIVDDDHSLRKSLSRLVTRDGHTADEASGTDEAFEKLETGTFQAVITDVQMPGGSGIELLQMMLRGDKTPPTYVHSSDKYLHHLNLEAHVPEFFGAFASFKLKDGAMLTNIRAFLDSIPMK